MKMTARDKKLLCLWPLFWPVFVALMIHIFKKPDLWTGFFIAVALQIAILAAIKFIPILCRFIRPPTPSNNPRSSQSGFTLIELLTVIAIIGVLVALVAPVLKNFSKPDVTIAATRQLLDDMARARQLAISQRTTVYVVFVSTNFWSDPLSKGGNQWNIVPTDIQSSMVTTQLYGAQWRGYMMCSLRSVGDQPGRVFPKTLSKVITLPSGAFIAPFKFTAPQFGSPVQPPYPTNRTDLPIYGFLTASNLPFPTADALTNATFADKIYDPSGTFRFVTVPFVAFNYMGQLSSADGTQLPYDENIPLDYGSIAETIDPKTKLPVQGLPNVIESPTGNSTNTAYNVIHIDRMTGRARLERVD
jgi:prepilin-type N-terminal cleavage/methylation domain-containing protein